MNVTLAPKVADRIGRAFPQRALLLGIEWFRTGGVEVESISDDAIAAAVKGKQRRQQVKVAVAAAGKAVATSCSCHASTLEGAVCSHVWAVVLEVDRRGALERLRTSNRNARVVALEEKVTPKAERSAAKEGDAAPATGRPSRRSPRASAPPPEAPAPKRRRPRGS